METCRGEASRESILDRSEELQVGKGGPRGLDSAGGVEARAVMGRVPVDHRGDLGSCREMGVTVEFGEEN